MDVSDEDKASDFDAIVDTLINMFRDVVNRDVIIAVVENCNGDLNMSADALMNITSDNTTMSSIHEDMTPTESNFKEKPHDTTAALIETKDSVVTTPTSIIGDSSLSTNQVYLDSCTTNKEKTIVKDPEPLLVETSVPATEISQSNTKELTIPLIPQMQSVSITQEDCKGVPEKYSMTNTGALPKFVNSDSKVSWTNKFLHIIQNHNAGYRILIVMRGVPGSGKSHLARDIIENVIGSGPNAFRTHVFSTDDYFYVRGVYKFNKNFLSEAHAWNQNRVKIAAEKALSPIIVDNTNIEDWEMEPYLKYAVRNGYIVEIMESNTPWAKKASQCARRNMHNVPLATIQRMLDNYRDFSVNYLFRRFRLSYPAGWKPPVLRKIPIIIQYPSEPSSSHVSNSNEVNTSLIKENESERDINKSNTIIPLDIKNIKKETDVNKYNDELQNKNVTICNNIEATFNVLPTTSSEKVENYEEMEQKTFYLEMERKLEEIEKIEKEWDNGEGWDDNHQAKANNTSNIKTENEPLGPKPQRLPNYGNKAVFDNNLMNTENFNTDWSQISMFMSPWNEKISNNEEETKPSVVTMSNGTCIESGDSSNDKNLYTEITTTSRDINLYHISPTKEKIPQQRMYDKSTMTNEQLFMENYRCEYEEKHFSAFRKMFKHLPKVALRDIFDKCQGDVNWAVGLVVDDVENNRLQVLHADDLSDSDDNVEECGCMSAYNIIPDTEANCSKSTNIEENPVIVDFPKQRKLKKETSNSESIQLKKQLEQQVVIAENHYSEHCLKIRKWRRGELNYEETVETTSEHLDNAQASSSSAPPEGNYDYSDDEDCNSSAEEPEKYININVGMEFLTTLDNLFGRKDMTYPENVVPKISIPMSLLNEINALWMESLMHQLDENEKQTQLMVKQDEEFARALAMKEEEMAEAGREPVVPDMKEIMDMDLAMSLYQKDVAEWRNKEPKDWAARMSREKLYNLFPDLSQDVLSELLMAHDNNFQATVEVLLISTGYSDVVAEENGVNKYVMKKELERQEKVIEEEKKTLTEEEWPSLPKTENLDMSVVTRYRDEAEQHLVHRHVNFNKAQDYIRRGMTQVANYYSEVASFHKLKFEHCNSLAAACLIHVHAVRNPDSTTIDLHFLRVAEAKESLDLFLDQHIIKLKESLAQNRQAPKSVTLFFITGRGLHSKGMPRVKPAVKKRLRERGLRYRERNPGLLSSNVCSYDKLTHEVQVP